MTLRARFNYRFSFNRPANDDKTYGVHFVADRSHYTVPAMLPDCVRDLVANARKYSKPGSNIVVDIRQQNRRLSITVQDEGRGISADEVPQVAQFGYRGRNVGSHETMVGGLGLSKAWLIAAGCGGQLWLNSTPDVGTTVGITIPLGSATRTKLLTPSVICWQFSDLSTFIILLEAEGITHGTSRFNARNSAARRHRCIRWWP